MNGITRKVLDGEVLSPRECIRVIGSPHPLRNDRIDILVPVGFSIQEALNLALDGHDCNFVRTFIVGLDGHAILEQNWSRVRPKRGTTIFFRARVEGGAIRNIAMIAVAVLALVVAPYLAGPILGLTGTALTIGTALISAAITIGGLLLVNALFPIRPPETLGGFKQRYSITGASNQATPYQPIPVVLGRHRIYPVHAAKPYTEIIGNDQYLRMFVVWGYGPLALDQIKIGETYLASFDDLEVQHDPGYDGDPTTALYPSSVLEEQLQIECDYNVDNERTTSENVDEISVDITFPQGLYANGSKGIVSSTAKFQIFYRPTGGGTYILVHDISLRMADRASVRRGYRIVPPSRGQFDVKVIRKNALNDEHIDGMFWTALRGLRNEVPVKFSKAIATTAIRIKATGQLNGTINSLNGVATSVAHRSAGGSWLGTIGATQNPADLARLVLQGPANLRPVSDSKINLQKFADWGAYCDQKGWKYNTVVNSNRSVFSQIQDIAAAGRAVITFLDGRWSVMWDDTDDLPVIVQHFTPRNSWGFSGSRTYRRTPHGWRINFVNERKAWQDDERIVYDDGYSSGNATEFEAIEFPGITDPDLIWKMGRFHIAQVRLRPEIYELNCDFEHLACSRGSRVRITHDVPLFGQTSGRIKEVNVTGVIVDEIVTMLAGKSYVLRVRNEDGAMVLYSVVNVPGETTILGLVEAHSTTKVGDLWAFGELGQESGTFRVLAIEPGEDMVAKISLVDDAPEISNADKGAIPQFDSNISEPIDPQQLAPFDLRASEFFFNQGSNIAAAVHLTWQVERTGSAQSYEIQRTISGNSAVWVQVAVIPSSQTTIDIFDLIPGIYSFRVRAVYQNGNTSSWAFLLSKQILGLFAPPENVNNFFINILNDTATLSWTASAALNVSHYEIRYSPLLTGVTWGSAAPIQQHVSTTSVQVPSMQGTFLIRAVTTQGIMSPLATLLISDIPGLDSLNAVEVITEDPTFPGVKDAVEVISSALHLSATSVMSDWAALTDVDSLYAGTTGIVSGGIYYFDGQLDLGAVYHSRVTTVVEAHGETIGNNMASWLSLSELTALEDADPSEWNVSIQYRKTDVNPALDDWSGWSNIVVGDIRARGIQFRALLESTAGFTVVPVVEALSVNIDMDDRIDADFDLVSGTGNYRVDFTPPFKKLLGLSRADQNMATGDYAVITSKSETGFNIQYRNAAGTGISRVFDWTAKGYGRQT